VLASSISLLAAGALAWGLHRLHGATPWFPLTTSLVFLAGMSVAVALIATSHPFSRLGPANYVTTFRAGLVALIVAAVLEPATRSMAAALTAIAVANTALDGVDGFFARRTGLSSAFGARLDVESDSIFILALSVLLWRHDRVGAWVLAGGLYRYAFVAAGWVLPWMAQPLRPMRRGRVVAACHMLGLTIALAPVVPTTLATAGLAATLAALTWSFAVDVGRLWRGDTT